jgi:hypothetical protein
LKRKFNASALHRGRVLATGVTHVRGPECGETLSWTTRPGVCELLVDDAAGHYAPFNAGDLNAIPGGRIDAVMYPVPVSPGSGRSPGNLLDVGEYVSSQDDWDDDQKDAVRRLLAAYTTFAGRSDSNDDEVEESVQRWREKLEQLGIPEQLLRGATKSVYA